MRRTLSFSCLAVSLLGVAAGQTVADEFAGYYATSGASEPAAPSDFGEGSRLAAGGCPSFDCCECECCDCGPRVLGILPSDHCFDDFISPLSNPFYFEDPRSLSELRGIYLYNTLPNTLGDGDVQVYSGQIRGRVSERLSIIATRLANIEVNPGGNGAPHGFLAAPVGFKYNFIRDVDRQLLVSGGITYFIKGSNLANLGGGDFHFFLTGGKQIFDRGHWLSASGFRFPTDMDWGTQMWYWSNQWDYEVVDNIYGLVGVNWFHFMRGSNFNVGVPVTGLDLLNLPMAGAGGSGVVTGVIGGRWKPTSHLEVGSGFEFALTDRTDILKNRLYVDLIFRF